MGWKGNVGMPDERDRLALLLAMDALRSALQHVEGGQAEVDINAALEILGQIHERLPKIEHHDEG